VTERLRIANLLSALAGPFDLVLAAGVTIVMVTHSAAQAARLGSRHLRMEDRRLVAA
jgi:predicted ABC-type transport system involved in lysophospholipase L1 biosynthesis ATPase subunit